MAGGKTERDYIGEIPKRTFATFDDDTGILKVSAACNPMICITASGRTVFGDESWWSLLEDGEDPSDIADITDGDTEGQRYVKALRTLYRTEQETEQRYTLTVFPAADADLSLRHHFIMRCRDCK